MIKFYFYTPLFTSNQVFDLKFVILHANIIELCDRFNIF